MFSRALPTLVVLNWLVVVGPSFSAESPSGTPESPRRTPIVRVVQAVQGAIVNIHSERTVNTPALDDWPLGVSRQRVNGMGTGIILDPRGYIITNNHVVEDVLSLRVRLQDGTTYPAQVFARDAKNDLALLKVTTQRPLPTLPLGTARDLILGEPVIAIGNAYGYEHTVTTGIVSAFNRDVELNKQIAYKALIQTNASINPGNSGGPLLNIHGELIGVNVAIRAGAQGIAFAIPVDSMLASAARMLRSQRRPLSSFGLFLEDEVDARDHPVKRTVRVQRCVDGSPAARAGIQAGDRVVSVGELATHTAFDVERGILHQPAGQPLAIELERQGVAKRVMVILQEKPLQSYPSKDVCWQQLGLRVQPVPPAMVARINPQLQGGLTVLEVRPDSPAATANLRPNDILIGLQVGNDQWQTISHENVLYILMRPEIEEQQPMQFYIIRDGQVLRGWLGLPIG